MEFALWLENNDFRSHPFVPKLVRSKLDRRLGYKILVVNVAKFDQAWQKDQGYLPPGGKGDNYISIPGTNHNRYDRVKEDSAAFKKKGMNFDMSTVGLQYNIPRFIDGRHRFAYFRDQGVKTLPIAVHKEDYQAMKALFGLS